MAKGWTIKEILLWTTRYFQNKGIQEPRLEAEVLLARALQKDRVYLYINYDSPVNPDELAIMHDFVARRARGEPIAYITGSKEFMSLNFKVDPSVLIPRPDTEVLVETAINLLQAKDNPRICDVGTGSGAIAISLAYYLRDAIVYATDISEKALEIARENAAANKVTVYFYQGSLLLPVMNEEKFDLITANLPYITVEEYRELDIEISRFEPETALIAGGDGLDLYRQLLPQAMDRLNTGGYLLLEIGSNQAAKALEMTSKYQGVELIRDLSGHNRVVKVGKE
ncbi:MAG: peptide chain release factor N(5)-glutamine methyltransferase [Syntrophomonadaceae bacterium]|nr:peptide chain release factor N(5)-glutamine methyltransferase [Syntrophomonadaceae bacterium]